MRTSLTSLIVAATVLTAAAPARAIEFIDRLVEAASGTPAPAASGAPPFRVGLLLPQGRDWREASRHVAQGWALAVGIADRMVGERAIEISEADTGADPDAAVAAAQNLLRRGPIDVFAGLIAPQVAGAMAGFARRQERAVVFAGAIGDAALGGRCNPYVARTAFPMSTYQAAAGRFLAARYPSVMTMAPDDPAVHGVVTGFVRAYRAGGGRVVEQVWTPKGEKYSFASWLSRAQVTGPKMIYAVYEGQAARRIVHQHAKTGTRDRAALIGPMGLYGPEARSRRTRSADGGRLLTSHLPDLDEPASTSFVAAYRKAFDEDPDGYAFLGYENAMAVLLTAAELDGQVHDPARFIATMPRVAYDGIMPRGRYEFDGTNTARLTRLFWAEVEHRDGRDAALKRLAAVDVTSAGGTCTPTG